MKFQALIVAGLLGIFTSLASAQEEILLSEDFEGGLGTWTVDNSDNGLWHISQPGECLSATRMGAYNNGPAVCNYVTGSTGNSGLLISPPIVLSGLSPFTINLDYIRSVGAGGGGCVEVFVVGGGGAASADCLSDNSGTVQTSTTLVPPGLEGQTIQVAFLFATSLSFDNNHPGFYVDNIVVKNSGPTPGLFPITVVPMGSRYLAVTPSEHPDAFAISVISPPDSPTPTLAKFVQADGTLADTPLLQTSAEWGTVYVHGPEIIPDTEYQFRAVIIKGGNTSNPSNATTAAWGDVAVPANGVVNLDDILAVLNGFSAGCYPCPQVLRADVIGSPAMQNGQPTAPNGIVTLDDILAVLNAFGGWNPF